jgi:D-glycero-D-manno-heptose 1,7-bisphosphate phosphatase
VVDADDVEGYRRWVMVRRMGQPMIRILRTDPGALRRPALFVDRDGVLNRRVVGGYVTSPRQVVLLASALPALIEARLAGAAVIVVSNQGWIGRGAGDEADLLAVHAALVAGLAEHGVRLDATYMCPHHPAAVDPEDRSCACRKPEPGLLLAAARDLDVDMTGSVLVGDQPSDVEAALRAGLPAGRALRFEAAAAGEAAAADLAATVAHLLQRRGAARS